MRPTGYAPAVQLANRRVFRESEHRDDYTGMGSTVVAALIDDSWVITMLARDPEADAASLAIHPMRHVLTNAIGAREETEVEIGERVLVDGEVLLLCSDGLHGGLNDETLAGIMGSGVEVAAAAQQLRDATLDRRRERQYHGVAVETDRMTEHDDDVTLPLRKPPSAPAKRLGRYELLDRLGKGGMGIVYRARDTKLDRPVAVKMLLGDLEGDDETREGFIREARAAGELNHPNIIKVYDFGEDGGHAFIIMELLEGANLNEFLKEPAEPRARPQSCRS